MAKVYHIGLRGLFVELVAPRQLEMDVFHGRTEGAQAQGGSKHPDGSFKNQGLFLGVLIIRIIVS